MIQLRTEYPDWTEFNIEFVVYGVGAPFVGIGVYTYDKKYSWPDPEGTTKEEYQNWLNHITKQGYLIPEKYLNAYVKEGAEGD